MKAKKIVVVGGGPAGIMAAIRAAELGQDVILIEKNPLLGRKLLLSGKGRCNLTNACGLEDFLERFSGNGQFLRDAFKKFFNRDLINFFEKRGLRLKIERQKRVFPVTDASSSILEVLKKELIKNKVRIYYNCRMKDVFVSGNQIQSVLLDDGRNLIADRVILACGGVSYGFTGSTGEGLKLAEKLGHGIVPPKPGLVPIEIKENFPKALEGLALKNIRLTFSDGKKKIISDIGEMIFTGFGISGPLVLTLSGKIIDWLKISPHLFVDIDLKPGLSEEKLDCRLMREFKLNAKKNIRNTLKTILPLRLLDLFLGLAEIKPDYKTACLTLRQRRRVVALLKGMRMQVRGARPIEEAMITRGGVCLKDINPRTMESRLVKGLYFAGEMIDIDADTGGFNLQAAFSTGYLAGENAAYE